MSHPPVYFYIPAALWPHGFPNTPGENWSGFGLGIYAWTVQTYLWMKAAGMACRLVDTCPSRGIVFLHRNAFRAHPRGMPPLPERLLVCFQGDLGPHPDAQVHVVQNPMQANPPAGAHFMPHWPQPGLQPRAAARGDRFTRVAFFGHRANLAPELQDPGWESALNRLGLSWQPIINQNRWDQHTALDSRWNDYRTVDAVVAIRSFNAAVKDRRAYCHKPATKLYNAWLAGVPAILGAESGYQAARQTSLDYLEAATVTAALEALSTLKADAALRWQMVANGHARAQAVTPEALTQQWQNLIEDVLIPAYDRWCSHAIWQQALISYRRRWGHGFQRIQDRWHDWRQQIADK